ncbi:hypothetical protein RclHR1_02250003 [Rhizophagus clarus]|uniref:F-box domain-containing protein n=1 Tax=Rhizophagus clarus TaxID=94130 RepID=A0A2Z6QU54_9GLOM|nr:hypothetical protein RclHR1_02250003 [Rhizophagus clarus]GES82298.1 hypothetical protein GLOIN_2v1784405 [Rhizophagus clarus]
MSQLLSECISEICEYLQRDKIALRSCLLVNRLWCRISVQILWRNVWNYGSTNYITLVACLPDESKEILYNNGITIPPPTPNPPMFNYASFCKIISDYHIKCVIERFLINRQTERPYKSQEKKVEIMSKEICKLFMSQVSSVRTLHVDLLKLNIIFTSYPGSTNCLKYLTELCCRSNFHSDFFLQLSQICQSLQSICVVFDSHVSDGLMDLIFSQKNLKNLILHQSHASEVISSIIPSLEELSDTLIVLGIYEINESVPLPFPKNLHELIMSFCHKNPGVTEETFKELQKVFFPKLRILRFRQASPNIEYLSNFLEKNGKNLKELHLEDEAQSLNSLNLTVSKFCPYLTVLSTSISDCDSLRVIFESCQNLESIRVVVVSCIDCEMKEIFDVIIKHSPKKFFQFKIYYDSQMDQQILPELLERFYTSWSNRVPLRPFSFIVIDFFRINKFTKNPENMKVIEKFINLGVVKKFKTTHYDAD